MIVGLGIRRNGSSEITQSPVRFPILRFQTPAPHSGHEPRTAGCRNSRPLPRAQQSRRPRRQSAAHGGNAAEPAQRRSLRPHAERRHGLGPGEVGPQTVSHPQHAGRRARAGRHARSRSAITPAIGKSACWSRRRRESSSACGVVPFAGFCSDPCDGRTQGTDGHVRQPAVSQRRRDRLPPAHPLAADARGRARRGDVRQGSARDDDGAGRDARPAVRARARRRHACRRRTARTPARSRPSARGSRTG